MERVITAELSEYLLSKGLITRYQHGFLAKHSTTYTGVTNFQKTVRFLAHPVELWPTKKIEPTSPQIQLFYGHFSYMYSNVL